MNYTFCEDTVSDLHKDAYGFRPSESFWYVWRSNTDAEKQVVWDNLLEALEAEMKRYNAEQAKAIAAFDQRVAGLAALGAEDFEMALRWLHEAEDTQGDDDYLEYRLNLPYGHIARTRAANLPQNLEGQANEAYDLDAVVYAA